MSDDAFTGVVWYNPRMGNTATSTQKTTANQHDTLIALQATVARLSSHDQDAARAIGEHLQAHEQALAAQEQAHQQALAEKDQAYQRALAEKDRLLTERQHHIDYLQEQLALLRSKRFGRQSEQLKHLQGQLFDEAELERAIRETEEALAAALEDGDDEAESDEASSQTATDTDKPAAKPRPRRKPLPAHLRRVDVEVDVSDDDKQMMGDDWVLVGYETSEKLAVHDREYYVKRIKRAKYVRKSEHPGAADQPEAPIAPDEPAGIKVAPPMPAILPRAIADASLLAHTITAKFVDALSFYRYERVLQREGIDIGYATLCDWPIQLANRLEVIRELLMEALLDGPRWHLDETVLQVLGEPGREATQHSYLWAIRAGPPERPVVLFHYAPRRNLAALEDWLSPTAKRFNGVLITDEHKPYNRFVANHPSIQAHGACWAHLRRKFADALKGRKADSQAHKVLKQISQLYRLDGALSELNGDEKLAARQDKVRPQVDRIKATLDSLAGQYIHRGMMQTAIGYGLNNWAKLTAFLDHPDLPLDNNPIENAIRPFTVGRKNFLFSGSPRGAEASAFLYSLVETAKANGWEPKAYLEALFERFPYARTREEQRALLPMFLNPSDLNG